MNAVSVSGAAICAAAVISLELAAERPPQPGQARLPADAPAAFSTASPAQPAQAPAPEGNPGQPPYPLAAVECAGGGWESFTTPRFETQEECESWVLQNLRPLPPEPASPAGEAREFQFPQHRYGSGPILRTGMPLLI